MEMGVYLDITFFIHGLHGSEALESSTMISENVLCSC